MIEFRLLRADEIEARIARITEKSVSILLYKDARCDMRILDETVGAMKWQRNHEVINGNLFCNVGIYSEDTGEWIWKQDVGTESYTEAQKGEASDSFKRACFNWGIGRELYTAPKIFFKADQCNITADKKCFDYFNVDEIEYNDRRISWVKITNTKTKQVYTWGKSKSLNEYNTNELVTEEQAKELDSLITAANINKAKLLEKYGLEDVNGFTMAQYEAIKSKAEKAIIKKVVEE